MLISLVNRLRLGWGWFGTLTDPMLGPLQDNGGPTLTHALLPGSPAIDAGTNPDNLEFDQRGDPFSRVFGSAPDMGSFEFQDIIGDSNRDGRFNLADILQVLIAGKYNTGEPATFEEGDWNGDGFFDVFDITLALAQGNFEGSSEPAILIEANPIKASIETVDQVHEMLEPLEFEQDLLDPIELLAIERRR